MLVYLSIFILFIEPIFETLLFYQANEKQTTSVIFPHVLLLSLFLCTAVKSETLCTGGPFLSGVPADLWENSVGDTLPGCCDPSGTCYTSTSPADFSEIADSLQASLKSIIPIRRFAR